MTQARPARRRYAARDSEELDEVNAVVADPRVLRAEVLLYKVTDVARMLNMSRTVIFEQLRAGRLDSVKQGRTRLIPAAAVQKYVELLMRESQDVA